MPPRLRGCYFSPMSTLTEIAAAIAQLPPAQWAEVRRWMDAHEPKSVTTGNALAAAAKAPDFLARQRAIFGGRVLPDSQAVLDELRAERF